MSYRGKNFQPNLIFSEGAPPGKALASLSTASLGWKVSDEEKQFYDIDLRREEGRDGECVCVSKLCVSKLCVSKLCVCVCE